MEKRTGQEAGISTFHATTVTELLAQMQKYVIEHAVKGDPGEQGNNITSIEFEKTGEDENLTYFTATVNIENTPSTTFDFSLPNGKRGDSGVGLASIITKGYSETSPNYTTTTIQITYTDGKIENWTAFARHGERGNGILSMTFISSEVVGDKTLNKYNVEYTDGTTQELEIYLETPSTPTIKYLTMMNWEKTSFNNIPCFKKSIDLQFQQNNEIEFAIDISYKPTGIESPAQFSATGIIMPNIQNNLPETKFRRGTGVLSQFLISSLSYGIYFCDIAMIEDEDTKQLEIYIFINDRYGNNVIDNVEEIYALNLAIK